LERGPQRQWSPVRPGTLSSCHMSTKWSIPLDLGMILFYNQELLFIGKRSQLESHTKLILGTTSTGVTGIRSCSWGSHWVPPIIG
jgi:hypothetical protein